MIYKLKIIIIKRLILLFIGLNVLSLSCNQNQQQLSKKNIILILVDDLGIGDLSCYGSKNNYTPNIDGLAKSGIRFTNFYANSSVCSPTRAAVLAGQFPHKIGVKGAIRTEARYNFGDLSNEVKLISSYLKKQNYLTSYIGKWHLGLSSPDLPNDRGFDRFKGFIGDMVDSYWTHKRHNLNYMRLNKSKIKTKGHLTYEYSKWAIKEIKNLSRQHQPFFLTLSYNAPHQPIEAPNEWIDSIRLRLPEATDLQIKFTAFVEYLDWNIGRVIEQLKKEKLYNNTLILFVSDNGGAVGFGSDILLYRGGKGTLYEGGIRIPFIVSYPNQFPQNFITEYRASTVDIMPTLLEFVGFNQSYPTDGHSLMSMITQTLNSGDKVQEPMFFIREDNDIFLKAVILENWKLIQSGADTNATLELYQLPNENEVLNEKYPKKMEELKQLLHQQD